MSIRPALDKHTDSDSGAIEPAISEGYEKVKKYLTVVTFLATALVAHAVVAKPKNVFIKADCTGPLGQEVVTSLRQEIRVSAGYQLVDSLDDDGGYGVVITIYLECSESTLPSSERIVSIASIFGTGTCTGDTCSVQSSESSLQASLCSGRSGAGCGKDIYTSLDQYMSMAGDYLFHRLSETRKKTPGI